MQVAGAERPVTESSRAVPPPINQWWPGVHPVLVDCSRRRAHMRRIFPSAVPPGRHRQWVPCVASGQSPQPEQISVDAAVRGGRAQVPPASTGGSGVSALVVLAVAEVPLEGEQLALGVAVHALLVATELGVVTW